MVSYSVNSYLCPGLQNWRGADSWEPLSSSKCMEEAGETVATSFCLVDPIAKVTIPGCHIALCVAQHRVTYSGAAHTGRQTVTLSQNMPSWLLLRQSIYLLPFAHGRWEICCCSHWIKSEALTNSLLPWPLEHRSHFGPPESLKISKVLLLFRKIYARLKDRKVSALELLGSFFIASKIGKEM